MFVSSITELLLISIGKDILPSILEIYWVVLFLLFFIYFSVSYCSANTLTDNPYSFINQHAYIHIKKIWFDHGIGCVHVEWEGEYRKK